MFEVKNNSIKIDGTKGKYDNSVSNTSTRYGRNAVDNFYSYMEKPLIEDAMNPAPILDFGISKDAVENNIKQLDNFTKTNDAYLNSLPPLEFEYRYMPQLPKGEIDKEALIGAAYEEMGKREKVSVAEMDNTIAPTDNYTSKSLDINKDGYITNSEYASSILAADMFSKKKNPNMEDIDGTINQKGLSAVLEYSKINNAQAASELYTKIYNKFNLG